MQIAVRVTDAPTDADKEAMLHIIGLENERRASAQPAETPLPSSTNVELRSSYEVILTDTLNKAHLSYVDQASRKVVDKIQQLIDQFDASDLNQLKTVIQRLKDRKGGN